MEAFFEGGQSPYVQFIRKNLTFLNGLMKAGDWERLRRRPPCIMPNPSGEKHLMDLALLRVRSWAGEASAARAQPVAALPAGAQPAPAVGAVSQPEPAPAGTS